MGAERGTKKIAVEIKTFRSPSPIADLESGDWAVQSREEYPNPNLPLFRIAGVVDTAHNRYTLTHLDFDGDRYKSSLLASLEIRGNKMRFVIKLFLLVSRTALNSDIVSPEAHSEFYQCPLLYICQTAL